MKTKLKNKKAQVKVNQMAFMLIGVTIFFALVGMFALTIRMTSLRTTASELQEQNAYLLTAKLANSPEFSCGSAFGGEKSNCIDFDKIMILKQEIDKYKDFWGIEGIEIRILYPSSNSQVECNNANFRTCNLISVLSTSNSLGFDRGTFVAVCHKEKDGEDIQDKCRLGKLVVRYKGEYLD